MRLTPVVPLLCGLALVACSDELPALPDLGLDPDSGTTIDGKVPDDAAVDVAVDAAPCEEGAAEPCYDGPAGTDGVGLCVVGERICSQGSWSECLNQVVPEKESCNGEDDDCDGDVDDGLEQACYTGPAGTTGVGLCKAGVQRCVSGVWGACVEQVLPAAEVCNGHDDDCDGTVDGLTQSCFSGASSQEGVGTCRAGQQSCTSGTWGSCAGEVLPNASDQCTGTDAGADDDCDGLVDDGCTCIPGQAQSCGTDVGACVVGSQSCSGNTWGSCQNATDPTPEVCNNQDDDCDGEIDEALTEACYTGPVATKGIGECHTGSRTCAAGQWSSCQGEVLPAAEGCDGKDNNCDGQVDEGNPGGGSACNTGLKGVCAAGVLKCVAAAVVCQQSQQPGNEVCDGLDNDCNGQVDEGFKLNDCGGCGVLPNNPGDPCGSCGAWTCSAPDSVTCVTDPGMISISLGYCVDRFEATASGDVSCKGPRFGEKSDDYPQGFPDDVGSAGVLGAKQVVPVFACSVANSIPSRFITWQQAKRACENSGKRLCTRSEWESICSGGGKTQYPYGDSYIKDICNTVDASLGKVVPTAALKECQGGFGSVFDISGNVSEYLTQDDRVTCAVPAGGSYLDGEPDARCKSTSMDPLCGATYKPGGAAVGFRCCR